MCHISCLFDSFRVFFKFLNYLYLGTCFPHSNNRYCSWVDHNCYFYFEVACDSSFYHQMNLYIQMPQDLVLLVFNFEFELVFGFLCLFKCLNDPRIKMVFSSLVKVEDLFSFYHSSLILWALKNFMLSDSSIFIPRNLEPIHLYG